MDILLMSTLFSSAHSKNLKHLKTLSLIFQKTCTYRPNSRSPKLNQTQYNSPVWAFYTFLKPAKFGYVYESLFIYLFVSLQRNFWNWSGRTWMTFTGGAVECGPRIKFYPYPITF